MTYTMEILLKYLLFLFWYLVFSIFFKFNIHTIIIIKKTHEHQRKQTERYVPDSSKVHIFAAGLVSTLFFFVYLYTVLSLHCIIFSI